MATDFQEEGDCLDGSSLHLLLTRLVMRSEGQKSNASWGWKVSWCSHVHGQRLQSSCILVECKIMVVNPCCQSPACQFVAVTQNLSPGSSGWIWPQITKVAPSHLLILWEPEEYPGECMPITALRTILFYLCLKFSEGSSWTLGMCQRPVLAMGWLRFELNVLLMVLVSEGFKSRLKPLGPQ